MNVSGVGTDIVDVSRIKEKLNKPDFINLVFTDSEISYCESLKNKAQNYGVRFAAKEAYMKAIGTGWSEKANFKEIEVRKNEAGKPSIDLHGATLSHFEKSNHKHIFVSLSHTDTSAIAFVIITK